MPNGVCEDGGAGTNTDTLVEEKIALAVVVGSMQLRRMVSKAKVGRQDLFQQPNCMIAWSSQQGEGSVQIKW